MPTPHRFDYAIVRLVPRIERGEFLNVGVILFCRTRHFLGARVALSPSRLAALAPTLPPHSLQRHLDIIPRICAGGSAAGIFASLSLSERFHMLVAPRSTILQPSPVHGGVCGDAAAMLDHLFEEMVW